MQITKESIIENQVKTLENAKRAIDSILWCFDNGETCRAFDELMESIAHMLIIVDSKKTLSLSELDEIGLDIDSVIYDIKEVVEVNTRILK